MEQYEAIDFRAGYEEPSDLKVLSMALEMRLGGFMYHRHVKKLPLKGDEKMLEFGTGPGEYAFRLAKRLKKGGGRLVTIDISKKMLQYANLRLIPLDNVEVKQGALNEIYLSDESFDAVSAHFTLHELPEELRVQTVKELAKKIKPGGHFYLCDPTKPQHGIPVEQMKELAADAGLKEISVETGRTVVGEVGYYIYEK